MHDDRSMLVDGIKIIERPEITISNYTRVPAFTEWRKVVDADH
jgi:hypothetical protein